MTTPQFVPRDMPDAEEQIRALVAVVAAAAIAVALRAASAVNAGLLRSKPMEEEVECP